jgi:SAM-dependent methyltransferase
MSAGFSGEVAEFYARYRRGYDHEVVGWLTKTMRLDSQCIVLDLGCGTGQLTIPLAANARAVVGMDPEPDMLSQASQQAAAHGRANITWLLGADRDLPAIAGLLGEGSLAAITMANSIHLMDDELVFTQAMPLLRHGGGVAVVANSTPLWLQNSASSRAVRACLEEWFAVTSTSGCGTDQESRQRYAAGLKAAGYADVRETLLADYDDVLDVAYVIGHLYSAIPEDRLPPPDQRPAFEERIRRALPDNSFTEHVRVSALTGRVL